MPQATAFDAREHGRRFWDNGGKNPEPDCTPDDGAVNSDAMDQTKLAALVLTLLMTAALGAPGLQHVLPAGMQARDGFPISTFPMFSRKRPEQHRMTWVRGLDAERVPVGKIHYRTYNSGGMNQAMAHIRKARSNKPKRRERICNRIANGVAARGRYPNVAYVEIVDAYYLPAKVFGPDRDDTPERISVLVRCRVDRTASAGGPK